MKNNNLISISGKINSGKDTIGNIIQIFTALPHLTDTGVKSFLGREIDSPYKIKKFADKLKDMVCLLIGCTRQQLEDRTFKEQELGEEWWYYKYYLHTTNSSIVTGKTILDKEGKPERVPVINEKTGLQEWKFITRDFIDKYMSLEEQKYHNVTLVKLTPRLLLQLLGTECGREILHPNIWVNSLFADYISEDRGFISGKNYDKSKWIITDMRFPNEFEAVKDKDGITIKVNRNTLIIDNNGDPIDPNKSYYGISTVQHPSETALDQETRWDYVIDNNSTIEDLIKKVREILNKENII